MSAGLLEVESERRAAVALDVVATARRKWSREHRRPASLTAREALAALQFEALLVWTAAANIRHGTELTEGDFDRLTTACRWIDTIAGEVLT